MTPPHHGCGSCYSSYWEPWSCHSQHGRMTLWRHHLPDIYLWGTAGRGMHLGSCFRASPGPRRIPRKFARQRLLLFRKAPGFIATTMAPSCAFNCAQCAYRRTHIIAHTEHIDVANCTVVFCTVVYYFFPEMTYQTEK